MRSVLVAPDVFQLRPDYVGLIVAVDGLPSGRSSDYSRGLLAEAAEHAREVDAEAHPHIVAWHEAYRAFGAKPRRTRPSVDALLRRVPAGLPEVNQVVDLYNAVSVRHVLPIGGEDADAYQGPPRLVRATGDEAFVTRRDGELVDDPPHPGEVVWRDDLGVTCRRWNWRQCTRTALSEGSRRGWFVLERLAPLPLDTLHAAGEELIRRIVTVAPHAAIDTCLLEHRPGGRLSE
jgi:DNA/RNA-binding domain of Phe-tRNA-synthetase-like protein